MCTGWPLTGVEEATALAEPTEAADERVDLLSEEAGLAISASTTGTRKRRCIFRPPSCASRQLTTRRLSHAGSRRDGGTRSQGDNRSMHRPTLLIYSVIGDGPVGRLLRASRVVELS
jgi:hypothetical protein